MADGDHLRRVDGERAPVDADDRRRRLLRGFERPRALPVREPEQQRHAERPRERRREHGVDRAHVGDDRDGLRPQLLRRARPRSAAPRPAFVREAKLRLRQLSRQRAGEHAVGEHDHLVDQRGERADLRHRGRERRVPRIDLLRDEDEASAERSGDVEFSRSWDRARPGSGIDIDERLADRRHRARAGQEPGRIRRSPCHRG